MTINSNNINMFNLTKFGLPSTNQGNLLVAATTTSTFIANLSLEAENFSFPEDTEASVSFKPNGFADVLMYYDQHSDLVLVGLPLANLDDVAALFAALTHLGAELTTFIDVNGNVYAQGDAEFEYIRTYACMILNLYFGGSYEISFIYPSTPAGEQGVTISETVSQVVLTTDFENVTSAELDDTAEWYQLDGVTLSLVEGATLPTEDTEIWVTLTNSFMSVHITVLFRAGA